MSDITIATVHLPKGASKEEIAAVKRAWGDATMEREKKRPIPQATSLDDCRGVAARVFCDPAMSSRVMDPHVAEEIAKLLYRRVVSPPPATFEEALTNMDAATLDAPSPNKPQPELDNANQCLPPATGDCVNEAACVVDRHALHPRRQVRLFEVAQTIVELIQRHGATGSRERNFVHDQVRLLLDS